MKKIGINYRSKLGTALVEGERLELKIDRMTQNNEPIGDSAPLIYTPRKDGVIAASTFARTSGISPWMQWKRSIKQEVRYQS